MKKTAKKNQWHEYKEQPQQPYRLVYTKGGEFHVARFEEGGYWEDNNSYDTIEDVTHWMELPTPPVKGA